MKVRALESFAGKISMYKGENRDIENKEMLKDLMDAGYIEQINKRGIKDEGKQDNGS